VNILNHRRLGQHKKNQRNEFLMKWADGQEISWERDIDLWQFEDLVQDYLKTYLTRASAPSGGGGLSQP
jgi:hypothetical protein